MPKVRVSFMEMPTGISVTFMQGNQGLGRSLHFVDEKKLDEMLLRAGASIEDRNIAAYAIRSRSAGWWS
jgi:hypothetical protein